MSNFQDHFRIFYFDFRGWGTIYVQLQIGLSSAGDDVSVSCMPGIFGYSTFVNGPAHDEIILNVNHQQSGRLVRRGCTPSATGGAPTRQGYQCLWHANAEVVCASVVSLSPM